MTAQFKKAVALRTRAQKMLAEADHIQDPELFAEDGTFHREVWRRRREKRIQEDRQRLLATDPKVARRKVLAFLRSKKKRLLQRFDWQIERIQRNRAETESIDQLMAEIRRNRLAAGTLKLARAGGVLDGSQASDLIDCLRVSQ